MYIEMSALHKRRGTLPEFASTLYGIQHWYKHVFEHLGWMVLAAGKGQHGKIEQYKKSIERLIQTIDHVSAEYKDGDRKHDLNVMRMNTVFLLDFVTEVCC
jgi:hypothetical protein